MFHQETNFIIIKCKYLFHQDGTLAQLRRRAPEVTVTLVKHDKKPLSPTKQGSHPLAADDVSSTSIHPIFTPLADNIPKQVENKTRSLTDFLSHYSESPGGAKPPPKIVNNNNTAAQPKKSAPDAGMCVYRV